MARHHSAQTHSSLLARIPAVTGHELPHWLACLDAGPALLRVEERVGWLRDEHALPHGYAVAIVHEHELRRAAARV